MEGVTVVVVKAHLAHLAHESCTRADKQEGSLLAHRAEIDCNLLNVREHRKISHDT